jgi:hypothetical protein
MKELIAAMAGRNSKIPGNLSAVAEAAAKAAMAAGQQKTQV